MDRQPRKSIKSRIVLLLVVATLVPVLVLGSTTVLSLFSLDRQAESLVDETTATQQQLLADEVLSGVGKDLSRSMDSFVIQQWQQVMVWAQIPTIVDAAQEGNRRAIDRGLLEKSIEELEEEFLLTRELGGSVEARFLLDGLVRDNPYIVDAFFTDVNGFNVAYANKTSDFVQSDEDWWQAVQPVLGAQENRFRVNFGAAEFDESAGAFTVDISVPIYDRQDDRTVGAMKSELDLKAVQDLADTFADIDRGLNITIIGPGGSLLAETSTDHAVDRIMTADIEIPEQADSIISEEGVKTFVKISDVRSEDGISPLDDALDWTIVVEQDAENAFAAVEPVQQLSDDLGSATVSTVGLIIFIALVVVGGAIAAALIFARRITTPISELQERVETVATHDLPRYIDQVQQADVDTDLPAMVPLDIRTGDELERLADSFNLMQDTAARLAAEQAQMRRRNVATTFVSLGRRNQNLLGRQLKFIDELEQKETDTALLESLFKLDHLATRMRRNAESLLVLAGEDPPRRWNHPVSIQNVVRASAAEIEDYRRVRVRGIEDAAVQGTVATEVTHLLAELIENASSFSPPGSEIEVFGRVRGDHYRISVVDHGVGMEADELGQANDRVSNPVAFDQAPSAFLGLFVVGHLAAKHDIKVELQPTAPEGTTALVEIPLDLIAGVEIAVAPSAPLNRTEKVEAKAKAEAESAQPTVEDDEPVIVPSEPQVTSAELEVELSGDVDAELASIAQPDTAPQDKAPQAEAPQVEDPSNAEPEPATSQDDASMATTKSGFKVRKPGSHTKVRPRKGAKPEGAAQSERTAETVRDSLSQLRSGVDRAVSDVSDS